jgi:hypothetical protein
MNSRAAAGPFDRPRRRRERSAAERPVPARFPLGRRGRPRRGRDCVDDQFCHPLGFPMPGSRLGRLPGMSVRVSGQKPQFGLAFGGSSVRNAPPTGAVITLMS